jgi:hypothetical protein
MLIFAEAGKLEKTPQSKGENRANNSSHMWRRVRKLIKFQYCKGLRTGFGGMSSSYPKSFHLFSNVMAQNNRNSTSWDYFTSFKIDVQLSTVISIFDSVLAPSKVKTNHRVGSKNHLGVIKEFRNKTSFPILLAIMTKKFAYGFKYQRTVFLGFNISLSYVRYNFKIT